MRLVTFLRQPSRRKRLVVEAVTGLVKAWWLVRFRPFREYAGRLGAAHPGEFHGAAPGDLAVLRDVRWAIDAVNRSAGGRFTCLMQGMAGKAMLDRRNAENTLVLGAKLGGRDLAADEGMAAHAWLRVGPVIVLGGDARAGFAPITSYHSPGGR